MDRRQITTSGVCVGDRVVCVENLYHPKTRLRLVANGTTGVVAEFNLIKYDNGYKDKRLQKATSNFHSKFVTARAMTVHKAQGNEFTYTGIIIAEKSHIKPQIEIMYTALSRFKRKVYLFGTQKDLDDIFIRGRFAPAIQEQYVQQFAKRMKASADEEITS